MRIPGADYQNYTDIFYGINTKVVEPAIILISSAIQTVSYNPIFLFIVFALIGVILKFIAIRQLTELWFLSGAMYICYYFMYHEMIQIRAGVVSGLLLLAVKPVYERNWKVFVSLCLLGLTFHISALLIAPLGF